MLLKTKKAYCLQNDSVFSNYSLPILFNNLAARCDFVVNSTVLGTIVKIF